jgi:hypothetical protein
MVPTWRSRIRFVHVVGNMHVNFGDVAIMVVYFSKRNLGKVCAHKNFANSSIKIHITSFMLR